MYYRVLLQLDLKGQRTCAREARRTDVRGHVNRSEGNMSNVNRSLVTRQKPGRSGAEATHPLPTLKIEPCQYPSP